MALGAGYKAKAGGGKQTTDFKTIVAPAEFLPILPGDSLNKTLDWAEQEVLKSKAGREVGDIIGIKVAGGLEFEANYQETDLLWALALGGITTISGSGPYVHGIPLSEDISRWLAFHMEKDVNVWSFTGLMINALTFNTAPDTSPATISIDGVCYDLTQDTTHRAALTALSDPEKPRLLWHQSVLRIGDLGDALASPTDDQEYNSLSMVMNNNLAVDQRDATNGLYILEPKRNGRREITLTIGYPRYKADTLRVWQLAKTLLQADLTFTSGAYIFKIEFPTLVLKEFSAPAGDEGIIPIEATFQVYRNQGNTFMSTITEEMEVTITNDRDAAIWT